MLLQRNSLFNDIFLIQWTMKLRPSTWLCTFLFLLVEVKSIFSWNFAFLFGGMTIIVSAHNEICLSKKKQSHSFDVRDNTLKCVSGEFIYLSKCDNVTKFFFQCRQTSNVLQWQRFFHVISAFLFSFSVFIFTCSVSVSLDRIHFSEKKFVISWKTSNKKCLNETPLIWR